MKNRSNPLITRFSASPLQSLHHVHNMRACVLWHLLLVACFCHFDDRIGFSPTNNRIKGDSQACKHYQMRWMAISVEERKKKQHGKTQSDTYLCPLNRAVSANNPYICLTVTLCSVFLMAQCSCVGDDRETKKNKKRKNI